MMVNLFSIFDPASNNFLWNNWTSMWFINMIFLNKIWYFNSKDKFISLMLIKSVNSELKAPLKKILTLPSSMILLSLFLLIMINNLLSIFPYIFNSSSHLIFSLSMSLPLWLSLMMYGWVSSHDSMFAHMVPNGTPTMLMSFMVLIETISNLIRPLTLSIRLMANMVAGHLLMALLAQQFSELMEMKTIFVMTAQLMLIFLETCVSLIQAYVFITLLSLYISEIKN